MTSLLIVAAATGCHRSRPKGFPSLCPVRVTVENDGVPAEDVDLCLISERTVPWSVSGRTDSGGTAELATSQGNYTKAGAPVGTFKVTLHKNFPPIEELPGNQVEALSPQEKMQYTAKVEEERRARKELAEETTPSYLGNVNETPVRLEITKETRTVTIELGDY